jgi:hypothetical protein
MGIHNGRETSMREPCPQWDQGTDFLCGEKRRVSVADPCEKAMRRDQKTLQNLLTRRAGLSIIDTVDYSNGPTETMEVFDS